MTLRVKRDGLDWGMAFHWLPRNIHAALTRYVVYVFGMTVID